MFTHDTGNGIDVHTRFSRDRYDIKKVHLALPVNSGGAAANRLFCTLSTLLTKRITGALPSRSLFRTISCRPRPTGAFHNENHYSTSQSNCLRRLFIKRLMARFSSICSPGQFITDCLIRAFRYEYRQMRVARGLRLREVIEIFRPEQFVQQQDLPTFLDVRRWQINPQCLLVSAHSNSSFSSAPVRRQPAPPYDGWKPVPPPVRSRPPTGQ